MIINRKWAMPNSSTFNIKPIKEMIQFYITDGVWLDPFVKESPFKNKCITNDLNPEIVADAHVDALDFLKSFNDVSVDGVLFDPPYSPRQITEQYKSVGIKAHKEHTSSGFYSKLKFEIARILKPQGLCLCFGWNSVGIGKVLGFELEEVLLVCHGGAHNDTICTVERKK